MYYVEYKAWNEQRFTREIVTENVNRIYYFDRRRRTSLELPVHWRRHNSVTYEAYLCRIGDKERFTITEEFYWDGNVSGDTHFYSVGKRFYTVSNEYERLVGMGMSPLVRRTKYGVFKAGYLLNDN